MFALCTSLPHYAIEGCALNGLGGKQGDAMAEMTKIQLGKLRRWQGYLETLGEAAEYIAKKHEQKPHPIGWVNKWVYQC